MDMAPNFFATAVRTCLANGFAGVRETVAVMRALVLEARVNPVIRQAAIDLIYLQPERDEGAEIEAIYAHVRDRIKYVRDVHDVETVHDPVRVLRGRVGDCDDKSVLLASLLESVGYPTRFVVTGYDGGDVSHVYVQVAAEGDWVDLDASEYMQVGDAPPDPTVVWYEDIA